MSEGMEVEETALPVIESSDENNAKKVKILNLLFPSDAVPAEGKDVKKDKNKPLTKVVIRRLPPRLTKEAFIEQFCPLPPNDYFYFVRGDLSLGNHSFSRAYINFLNQDDIYAFKEKYDDYEVQDEKGRIYHAVVEFAPFQRVPRRNVLRKKLSKAGTLESETKYLEFLKKLEEYKNNATNTSEYFHETENTSLKAKVTTTPLLEYLKAKKQAKKNDLKNDIRSRRRELEKERKKKEEERRKLERERKKEEKKRYDDKRKMLDDKSRKSDERLKENRKNEVHVRPKEEKKDGKNVKDYEICPDDGRPEAMIATDPAILQVVMRQPDKGSSANPKILSSTNDESLIIKNGESDSNPVKLEKKFVEFRNRIMEEKQKKTFHKRDVEEQKTFRFNSRSRKGVPDEKGDNSSIGNWSEIRDFGKKSESELDTGRKQDSKTEVKEAKSKFRYSEQRNREREYRSQKSSDWKKDGSVSNARSKGEDEKRLEVEKEGEKGKERAKEDNENSGDSQDAIPVKNRRRSLELEKTLVEGVRKRSSSLHDLTAKKVNDFRAEKKKIKPASEKKGHVDDGSKENNSLEKAEDDGKKDVRAERRIRNKDRPSMEIYRPGMGKFSKQRLEQKKEEVQFHQNSIKNSRIITKSSNRKPSVENRPATKAEKVEERTPAKAETEVRTMTLSRSGSKEN